MHRHFQCTLIYVLAGTDARVHAGATLEGLARAAYGTDAQVQESLTFALGLPTQVEEVQEEPPPCLVLFVLVTLPIPTSGGA